MTFKTAMSGIGNGLVTGLSVISNAQTQTQIDEIDTEIRTLEAQLATLNQRKTDLQNRLIGL